jgi:hypothetical protein
MSGPDASIKYFHTRAVSPQTVLGEITSPCERSKATVVALRPSLTTRPWAYRSRVFTDGVRWLYAPLAVELPHRVANALFARCRGVSLSWQGARGIIDNTAEDLRTWQPERERQEAEAVGQALAALIRPPRSYGWRSRWIGLPPISTGAGNNRRWAPF